MLLGVLLTAALLTLLGVNLFLTGERKVEHAIPVLYGARDPRFVRAMGSCWADSVRPRVDHLRDPYLLVGTDRRVLRRRPGGAGARRRPGDVMLDWAGSGKIDLEYLKRMQDAGVEVERYHKPRWGIVTIPPSATS
jgi:cardiolipin synthase